MKLIFKYICLSMSKIMLFQDVINIKIFEIL